jgi:hypothetical protein
VGVQRPEEGLEVLPPVLLAVSVEARDGVLEGLVRVVDGHPIQLRYTHIAPAHAGGTVY